MIGCVEYILMLLFYNIGEMKKISKDCVVFIRWLNNNIILVYVYVFIIGIVIMILNIYFFLKYIKFFGNFNCWYMYIDYWYYMNIFLGIYICSFILNII